MWSAALGRSLGGVSSYASISCEGQQHHFLSWAWLCDGEEEGTLSPCCQHKCMLHQWHPVINSAEGQSVWQSNCKATRWWTRSLGAMGSQTPSAILARASWQSEDITKTWWFSKTVSLPFKHFLPKLAIGTQEKNILLKLECIRKHMTMLGVIADSLLFCFARIHSVDFMFTAP